MWHKQSFTQFWSQSDAYSRRSSLKLTYIHHPLVVCTHQICCAVAVPIALSQDRLLHGHNRLVNWTPCSRRRESKLKITINHTFKLPSTCGIFIYHLRCGKYGYNSFNLGSNGCNKCPSISCASFTSREDSEIKISPIVVPYRSTLPPFFVDGNCVDGNWLPTVEILRHENRQSASESNPM